MKRKFNISFTYLSIYTFILLVLVSCANIISPNGGPKDITPPKLIKSEPPNYSLHFNKNKIELVFNEFIVLKDIKNQMIISPPFNEMPEIKLKGKTMVIELDEKLKENTTYTLYFGNAITDLTEGNAIPAFEYVFSTGNIVDSMTITGRVVDAFNLKPEKDFFVMLYDSYDDSIPYKEKPYYLAKTSETGYYAFNNLRNMPYKIFVLKDENNNYKFDQPIEKIAFTDSLVFPHIKPIIVIDTSLTDSMKQVSLKAKTEDLKKLSLKDLLSFNETDTMQRLLRAEFSRKGLLFLAFRYPVKDFELNLMDSRDNKDWKLEEWNTAHDTLLCWLLKPDMDTLNLFINDNKTIKDTLFLQYKQRSSKNTKTEIQRLFPATNISQTFDYSNKISFTFPNPVLKYDSLAVKFIEANDTLQVYALNTDALHRKYMINRSLKEGTEYKLRIKEDLITDIFGFSNDSLKFNFKTNTAEDVGNFIIEVSLKDTNSAYIIQLLNENEVVLSQRLINKSSKITFRNLAPATYQIKAIVDSNHNGKWDTGNYLQKKHAEKVIYFPTKISIRANWDLEEKWDL
ncbi:MAG: Ig-like domain-containing protein [Bacteroidetes bacterium]|nr:Ig-like domain-containing protein [Bacteroidota bacterium]